jgi:hypothetical protein
MTSIVESCQELDANHFNVFLHLCIQLLSQLEVNRH